jgi:integral membrane protein (TIGR01906 family)
VAIPRSGNPSEGLRARFGAWLLASATALVLLGASVAPFLTPAFVRVEQDRVGVGALTGYGPTELDAVTGALLGDLVLWRGDFDVSVGGVPVLSEPERAHMRDVRGVFTGFWLLVVAAAILLIVAFRRDRDTEARFARWRAVAGGARALAIAIVVVGAFVVLAFEAAFEVFHRLFFSAGSYTFDPSTDRIVQLFPYQFWSETAIAVGTVALAASILTMWQAWRRAGAARSAPVFAPSKARP